MTLILSSIAVSFEPKPMKRKCGHDIRPLVLRLLCIAILTMNIANQAHARIVKSLIEIRRENVVVQQWDLSCGAAALTTLLNFQHHDMVTEKEVATMLMNREEYIKNPLLVNIRQGFSLLDLKRYADGRGYEGIGYGKLTLDDLTKRAPIIIPINLLGYNHFVVFRGMKGNRVLLADPAWGNRTLLVKQFEDAWISFPEVGKVGFVVARTDGTSVPNLLEPRADEFVMLQ